GSAPASWGGPPRRPWKASLHAALGPRHRSPRGANRGIARRDARAHDLCRTRAGHLRTRAGFANVTERRQRPFHPWFHDLASDGSALNASPSNDPRADQARRGSDQIEAVRSKAVDYDPPNQRAADEHAAVRS